MNYIAQNDRTLLIISDFARALFKFRRPLIEFSYKKNAPICPKRPKTFAFYRPLLVQNMMRHNGIVKMKDSSIKFPCLFLILTNLRCVHFTLKFPKMRHLHVWERLQINIQALFMPSEQLVNKRTQRIRKKMHD